VLFTDARTKLEFAREVMFAMETTEGPLGARWEDSKWAGNVALKELGAEPASGARFVSPEDAMLVAKSYAAFEKKLVQWLHATQGITRWKSAALKQFSEPGEDERAFRARLSQASREARDQATQELRGKYAPKLATLEDRIRRAQAEVQKQEAQAAQERQNAAFAAGGGLLSAFLGGTARGAVASATRAAKSAGRVKKEQGDVAREKENVDALVAKYRELDAELRAALAGVSAELDPASAPLEQVVTKPKKTGITVHTVALAWRAQ
jgi:chromosome segregation ATPase